MKRREDRAAKVAEIAKDFISEVMEGKLDPDDEDFNQASRNNRVTSLQSHVIFS